MNKITYIIAFAAYAVFTFSNCGQKHDEGGVHKDGTEINSHSDTDGLSQGDEEEHREGLFLTKQQAETIGLEFGDLSSIKLSDFVKATGTLGLPPNAYSSASAQTNGIIKGSKKYVEGDYINKGSVIAYLENPDFIKTQQEYLETIANLKLKQLEVERQRTLVEANAGVTKNLQSAEAEVAVLEAKSKGLSKQLSYLGISTSQLTTNSIRQQITIEAPMSGYISKINFHNGMYAQSSVSLMDIISTEHLHLELDVFEKDISKIKKGQNITYTVPALGQTVYNGEVSVLGKEFNTRTKTVRVHGHLEGEKPVFVKDLFINAKIWLNDNTTTALPDKAIIRDGENAFIYTAKNDSDTNEFEFKKLNVVIGASDNGFTAVKLIDTIPERMQIVTKGAYYVYAQSKAGELEHEH